MDSFGTCIWIAQFWNGLACNSTKHIPRTCVCLTTLAKLFVGKCVHSRLFAQIYCTFDKLWKSTSFYAKFEPSFFVGCNSLKPFHRDFSAILSLRLSNTLYLLLFAHTQYNMHCFIIMTLGGNIPFNSRSKYVWAWAALFSSYHFGQPSLFQKRCKLMSFFKSHLRRNSKSSRVKSYVSYSYR